MRRDPHPHRLAQERVRHGEAASARGGGQPGRSHDDWNAVHLIAIGLVVRAVSGFFGIGGGFLIVRGLMLATGMPILNAIGSSPFSVGSFGLTTAINHALSGLIERAIALLFIPGGVAGATVARA